MIVLLLFIIEAENNLKILETRLLLHSFIESKIFSKLLYSPANGQNLLSSNFSLNSLLVKYRGITEENHWKCYSTFLNHFNTFFPDYRIMTSKSDYCSFCFIQKKVINYFKHEENVHIAENL